MTALDHLLAILVIVVMPLVGFVSFQRLLRRVDSGEAVNRPELYQANMSIQWILLLLTAALWIVSDRSFTTLGFRLDPDTWFMGGIAVTIAGVVILVMQLNKVKKADTDELRDARSRLGKLKIIFPHTRRELGLFYRVSVTAGIVEETLWRGFVIWYLSSFMPLWAAALISVISFGIAHAYQGISQVPMVTLVGAIFTGLFFLSGSLWLPMILHAAVDILQGRAGYEVVRRGDSEHKPGEHNSGKESTQDWEVDGETGGPDIMQAGSAGSP